MTDPAFQQAQIDFLLAERDCLRAQLAMKRSRIRPMSRRRAEQIATYSVLRRDFLERRPKCEKCQKAKSRDVHHKAGRYGGNYLNVATWAALCRSCHDWIHQHPGDARATGWLA